MSNQEIDSKNAKVLIVDDARELADMYAAWLADLYSVETTYSGEQALEQIDDGIDVMLLDRRMPGLSGGEVLEYIREEGFDIRVIMVSAVSPDFEVLNMGFDEYLVKPVDREELHDTIERMLIRSTYDDALMELEQLRAVKSALDPEKSAAELQECEDYRELETKIRDHQSRGENAVIGFGDDDLKATFGNIDSEAQKSDLESK